MTEEQLREIEARAKVATCKADIESVYPAVCAVVFEDIPALVAEVRRLREGLEFYADKTNWRSTSTGFAAQYDRQSPPAVVDGGIKARLALMSQLDPQKR